MQANFAEIWSRVARALPDRIAVVSGSERLTYAEFDALATRLVGMLHGRGVARGDRVGILMYNRPEYVIALFAAFKIGAIPVTINYRYRAAEVAELLADCGASVLVFPDSLTAVVDGVGRLRALPGTLVRVGDTDGETPHELENVFEFDDIAEWPSLELDDLRVDDELLLYTGGTTGRPKAVVWTLGELFDVQLYSLYGAVGIPIPTSIDEVVDLAANDRMGRTVTLPLAPFMHGTALFNAMNTFVLGGTLVIMPTSNYHPDAAIAALVDEHVTRLIVAGDAVTVPLLDEADARGVDSLPHLRAVISSGMKLSDASKIRLHALGDMAVSDILASTEGGPYAIAVTRAAADLPSRFQLAPGAVVLDDSRVEVQGVLGAVGVLGYRGTLPKGYYNDPVKTEATYPELGGIRHVIPGDYVRVESDGFIELLGRGSSVVNSGGEKVYPAEVEEVLLSHPGALDAVVFGIADPRWGELVAAVVAGEPGELTEESLMRHVGEQLAGYKKPKTVLIVRSLDRSPSGKVDIPAMRLRVQNHITVTNSISTNG